MTALLIDHETIRELLTRLEGLSGDARREVIFTAAIESGGIFHGPVAGNAALHLHRIPVVGATEDEVIDAWIRKASERLSDDLPAAS
ncbi:hypothetical protein SAMN06297129_3982 [Pseudooceanicola antarcticus]|uniref:Uncharacterized protein n=1 Tax=Pseudooceanicola antarcticus TaxID=1247613 RepID=A0A285JKI6_9RHOB|nr:hypothetical protein [Pseudooceanicola antarcticus]PJE26501.1 hypothetical protein CVM39_17480 [Pseudooceanicola antarcticus]SNY60832.1 hypothetical protein SAMN06297129_3982 [Pseudooceanicola antarcticus]